MSYNISSIHAWSAIETDEVYKYTKCQSRIVLRDLNDTRDTKARIFRPPPRSYKWLCDNKGYLRFRNFEDVDMRYWCGVVRI